MTLHLLIRLRGKMGTHRPQHDNELRSTGKVQDLARRSRFKKKKMFQGSLVFPSLWSSLLSPRPVPRAPPVSFHNVARKHHLHLTRSFRNLSDPHVWFDHSCVRRLAPRWPDRRCGQRLDDSDVSSQLFSNGHEIQPLVKGRCGRIRG